MDPVAVSLPVDVRVPFHSLQDVRAFLGYHEIHNEIMIQDLQDHLDKEQSEMMRSRVFQPRTTDDYDYSNYHTLSELDFWMDPVAVSLPVDVRVPFHSLQDVRAFLGYHEIHNEIMIQDLQDHLDKEQSEMMRSRVFQPRTTDDYDYSNYHTLSEVRPKLAD
ncbi:carboxypeptidase A1-like [Tachysurus ichikawai]